MSETYVRVVDGAVWEIIPPHPDDIPLAERFPAEFAAALVPAPEGVAQGWLWDGSTFTAPPPAQPPAPVVPASITRRQLLLALAGAGLITAPEALAAATTGAVPASIDAVFAELPAGQALAARITWATMGVAEREHPLIGALVAAELATAAEVDALFIAGGAL
jgi:hypothetical protein